MQLTTRNSPARAAELLRAAVMDGRLRPGERLKEAQLAEQFGLSRTPIREALLLLQAEGVIDQLPNKGATVRTYTPEQVCHTYEIRAVLEGYACYRAASRIDADALQQLDQSIARFDEFTSQDTSAVELAGENDVFHNVIIAAAGNPRLVPMVRATAELPLLYRAFYWQSQQQIDVAAHGHKQIARALRAGDADRARVLMLEHVWHTRDILVERLRAQEAER